MPARSFQSRRDVVPALLGVVAGAVGRGTGSPNGVVLTAPSGAGKSHLLREFRGLLTIPARSAAGTDASSTRPFGVACDLFGVDEPNAASFLIRADALLADGPLALSVDDLHLVDADTLALLHELITLDAPIVLAATRRPEPTRPAVGRLLGRSGVIDWPVPAFDQLDIDVLVHDRTGAWPGQGLRALLAPVSSNALHLTAVLDGLLRNGAISGDDVLELVGEHSEPLPSLGATVHERIRHLARPELDLVRALAVFGQPSDPAELAAVLAIEAIATMRPVQNLLDAGLVVAVGEDVDFAHDAFRQSVYEDTPAPLRRLLHRVIADRLGSPTERARHVIATQPESDELLQVVRAAVSDLNEAPGVTADLLEAASGQTQNAAVAAELAVTRARALARSGQLQLSDQVAADGLRWATQPAIVAELRRIAIFAASTGGRIDDAIRLVDATLAGPIPDAPRRILTDHRLFLNLLGGHSPVPLEPFTNDPRELTVNGLIAELLRRFMLGDSGVALEYAWAASRRSLTAEIDPNEGLSADLWAPYVALGHGGADAGREALRELTRAREERGTLWQTAPHHAAGGAIDLQSARLADAAAQLDAALELGARMELGSLSQALAGRAIIDVMRGDSRAGRERIERWSAPEEFGLPSLDRARIAVLEAERRYTDSARLAATAWERAGGLHLYGWQAMVAPDFARVALRASDDRLASTIHQDLAEMPQPAGVPGRMSAGLASMLTGSDYESLGQLGPELAEQAQRIGNHLLGLVAVEESAVAAAVSSDKDRARTLARQAIGLAEDAGARGVAARIAGRLRVAGARLGSSAAGARPDFGWGSLTPTEGRIVDLVVGGTTGPEIAHQLHLSPRTVQTHVSHALAKLGLSSRVELASAAARRAGGATS